MNQMSNFYGGGSPGNGGNGGGFNLPGPLSKFGNMMNVVSMFKQFMQNPISAMLGSGLNIPQNIQNNPDGIVNYMRSSGIMTDNQYNQCSQLANFAMKFLGGGR